MSRLQLQPGHYSSLPAPNFQPTTTQERDDQCGNQHYSRELLMIYVVVPETCWAYKKYSKIRGICLVLILQLTKWCTIQNTSKVVRGSLKVYDYSSVITWMLYCTLSIYWWHGLSETWDISDPITLTENKSDILKPVTFAQQDRSNLYTGW